MTMETIEFEKAVVGKLDEMGSLPFCSGDVEETVIDWIRKIESLGKVMSELAWQAKNHSSSVLDWYGEEMGNIVADYAGALGNLLNAEVMPVYKAASDGKAISNPLKAQLMFALEKKCSDMD